MSWDDEEDVDDPEEPDVADQDESDEPDRIACRHCGGSISEEAEQCPHCGNYLSVEGTPMRTSWWIILGAALAGGAVLVWFLR